jgi:hypothetical protein
MALNVIGSTQDRRLDLVLSSFAVDLGGSQCEKKIDGIVKENVFCGRVVHCR